MWYDPTNYETKMKTQIAEYLAQGYKASAVATMVGCSEAYISEIFKDDNEFRELLKSKMTEFTGERINNKYNQLEEATLKSLNQVVGSEMLDVNDLTRVLESIAKIKNANKATVAPAHYTNPTVGITLVFPEHNIPKLVTDDNNRVVAIGDKTMLPMPARAVRAAFTERMKKENVIDQVPDAKLATG